MLLRVAALGLVCYVYMVQLQFSPFANHAGPVVSKLALAIVDSGLSCTFYVLGVLYAHYWKALQRNSVLPRAVAYLLIPYTVLFWPFRYNALSLVGRIDLVVTALIFFVLSALFHPDLSKRLTAWYEASSQDKSVAFARFPPARRSDMFKLDLLYALLLAIPLIFGLGP